MYEIVMRGLDPRIHQANLFWMDCRVSPRNGGPAMTREASMAHGELIDGVWHTRFHNTKATGGRFQRGQPKFRNWVTADGSAGPSGAGGFPAARGRYHVYVSLACPRAHRTANVPQR